MENQKKNKSIRNKQKLLDMEPDPYAGTVWQRRNIYDDKEMQKVRQHIDELLKLKNIKC